ncbi:hypothetical protein GGI17_004814 [Coemansia sp. S146]|nr:hypothetical protein GGI17_004814 [Coemansia sp. S146]
MPARRTNLLSAAYRAFGFVSRYRPSSLQTLLPIRRLSSHSQAGPSDDIRKAIVEKIRLSKQQKTPVSWYELIIKYRLSNLQLQCIYNQAEFDPQQRQQSVLVTRAAGRHFDSALGQCNWEAVASELDIPLIECLNLFDSSSSTIQPHSPIETYGGWSRMGMDKLKRFIAAHYSDNSTVDWKRAGTYMNVCYSECQRVGQGTFNDRINEVGYRRICEFRESTLSWRDIHQHFLQYPNEKSLQSRYHDQSTTELELVDIIKRELPARPLSDISRFSRRYVYELKAGRMNMNQMIRMRELVDEYGEDWARIGKALGVPSSRARRNWLEHGRDVGNHAAWTVDETRQLQHLIDSGVKPKEAVKLLRIRLYRANQDKSPVAKSLVLDDHENSVTREVQRQLRSSGSVDWSQVSQVTGLGMRKCLELSQHDVDKASWHYDPDSFSQGMVDRMTDFVKEHYPAPAPVNSRAVSNFMWVAMGDCIRIHNMFQGKFTWTEADYEQADALRAQGLTFQAVARHLSPKLTGQNVCGALKRYSWLKKVRMPYTSPVLEEISRLIDEYAGKYPVDEILSKISERMGSYVYKARYYAIVHRLTAHPHYLAKYGNIDFNDVANRIVTGQITTKLAAKELDLPKCELAFRIKHLSFKLLS